MSAEHPSAAIVVREHSDRAFYEAKFRHEGRQVKRRIGPAWLERDAEGQWRPRRGRVQAGFHDLRSAHVAAAEIVKQHVDGAAEHERAERERRNRGASFREVAHSYLRWLADVAGAKPATLRDHRCVLAEPGVAYRRGKGKSAGHVMGALGDLPAAKITTREIN
jgi:hypothetical protein